MQYRWHPLFGSKLHIVKIARTTGFEDVHCELPDGVVIATPRRMTDTGRCLPMEIGDPIIALDALAELRSLLDGLKSP